MGDAGEGRRLFAWHTGLRDFHPGIYPERFLLLSGYISGEKQLQNRPSMVWVRAGKGQLVLFGFRPQFRGSTPATFKLVFNSLLLPPVK